MVITCPISLGRYNVSSNTKSVQSNFDFREILFCKISQSFALWSLSQLKQNTVVSSKQTALKVCNLPLMSWSTVHVVAIISITDTYKIKHETYIRIHFKTCNKNLISAHINVVIKLL